MSPSLSTSFTRTIQNTYGEDGRKFLADLPFLIEEAACRWNLTQTRPVSNLSYNFVARAYRGGQRVVLKIGLPGREFASEIAALRLFAGKGAVRLLEEDASRGMFLMEHIGPGRMLAALKDDEQATRIAAGVMLSLWRQAPQEESLIHLSDWFKGLETLRTCFAGGTGPLERGLVERAERAVADFFSEDYTPMLIHGDLHHFNILLSEHGWLAIDPKGVIGPAAYEVGPLLTNPWMPTGLKRDLSQLTDRRIVILSESLGFERERIREWGIAHAVLSAWWGITDHTGWDHAMNCAGMLSKARI